MLILLAFSFLAGVVTILSPCILPVLPIILSSSFGGKSRPLGVVVGFIISFSIFTLLLSTIVRLIGIPADTLRLISVFVIAGFGLALLLPVFQVFLEKLFAKLSGFVPQSKTRSGFFGGVLIGISLGLLWTPCVGPILASIISLAIIGTVTLSSLFIILAYSLGTAIPMLIIMIGGQKLLQKTPWLLRNSSLIQKIFGVIMILTAVLILFNVDRSFQTFVINKFPQYGVGLTKIEDNNLVKQQLQQVNELGSEAPEIIAGGEWFNSPPLTIESLKGKVVLVDFWTYSCINCQRTFPYLRNWWEKYKDKGLVIIGVHSPEFEFEKNPDNVQKAITDFGITYPVVQDNDFATWRAYNNRYWPAKYFINKDGQVVYSHFGEGDYDNSERIIQMLLAETGAQVSENIDNTDYQNYSQTPETYLGYTRMTNFSSPEKITPDKVSSYSFPTTLLNNTVAYEGNWLISSEYSNPQKNGKLEINFSSKNVFLVARPKSGNAKIKVYLDDKLQNTITVDSDKLYQLINMSVPGRHILRLEFDDNNAEVYAFTFG